MFLKPDADVPTVALDAEQSIHLVEIEGTGFVYRATSMGKFYENILFCGFWGFLIDADVYDPKDSFGTAKLVGAVLETFTLKHKLILQTGPFVENPVLFDYKSAFTKRMSNARMSPPYPGVIFSASFKEKPKPTVGRSRID